MTASLHCTQRATWDADYFAFKVPPQFSDEFGVAAANLGLTLLLVLWLRKTLGKRPYPASTTTVHSSLTNYQFTGNG